MLRPVMKRCLPDLLTPGCLGYIQTFKHFFDRIDFALALLHSDIILHGNISVFLHLLIRILTKNVLLCTTWSHFRVCMCDKFEVEL